MAPVVAAEPVWATLMVANQSISGAIFELRAPSCSCPTTSTVDIVAAPSTLLLLLLPFQVLRRHAAGVLRCTRSCNSRSRRSSRSTSI